MLIIYQPYPNRTFTAPENKDHKPSWYRRNTGKPPSDNCAQPAGPAPVISEVVTCICVRNSGGHADISDWRSSEEVPAKKTFSFSHVIRPMSCLSPQLARGYTTHGVIYRI